MRGSKVEISLDRLVSIGTGHASARAEIYASDARCNVHHQKASLERSREQISEVHDIAQVQILVHVRPADSKSNKHFETLDCDLSTTIGQIKHKIQEAGSSSGQYHLPIEQQELVFLEERCEDQKSLRDYGINKEFIVQVTGFVVNPAKPGKRFQSGVLVPAS